MYKCLPNCFAHAERQFKRQLTKKLIEAKCYACIVALTQDCIFWTF